MINIELHTHASFLLVKQLWNNPAISFGSSLLTPPPPMAIILVFLYISILTYLLLYSIPHRYMCDCIISRYLANLYYIFTIYFFNFQKFYFRISMQSTVVSVITIVSSHACGTSFNVRLRHFCIIYFSITGFLLDCRVLRIDNT